MPLGSDDDYAVVAQVGGLIPGRTYYFRLVAQNAQGSASGDTVAFSTPPGEITGFDRAGKALESRSRQPLHG